MRSVGQRSDWLTRYVPVELGLHFDTVASKVKRKGTGGESSLLIL